MAAVQFTITNLTAVPSSGYVAAGEAISVSFKINNTGSFPIHQFDVSLVSGWWPSSVFIGRVFSQSSIAIAKGKSHVVSFTAVLPELPAGSAHIVDGVEASVWCWTHSDYGPDDTVSDSLRAPLPFFVLDMRYQPRILELSAARTPTEDADACEIYLRCSLAAGTDLLYEGLKLELRWREQHASEFPPANVAAVDIGQAIGEGGARTVPAFAFEAGKAYVLRATFTDGVDTALAEAVVPKSFAVLDVSPDGYGVGIGQYATGTEESPKFECAYPAHLYGGVANLPHAHILAMLGIQTGETNYPSGVPNGWRDTAVTFPIPYKQPPLVFIFPQAGNIASANVGSNLLVLMQNTLSKTGFSYRWYNNTSDPRYPQVRWIAMGELDN